MQSETRLDIFPARPTAEASSSPFDSWAGEGPPVLLGTLLLFPVMPRRWRRPVRDRGDDLLYSPAAGDLVADVVGIVISVPASPVLVVSGGSSGGLPGIG